MNNQNADEAHERRYGRQPARPVERHLSALVHSEYTLCGIACDINAAAPETENPVFAEQGELISCRECRAVIDYCRSKKNYRA